MHVNSPRTDDDAVEQEIQAKGLVAPRVTPADIEAAISSEFYFTASQAIRGAASLRGSVEAPLFVAPWCVRHDENEAERFTDLLTFCVLVLKSGFTVTGESACASPENFDAELGRKIARANAVNKLWPLMGYALKERLSKEGA